MTSSTLTRPGTQRLPRISVITASFNSHRTIRETIQSVCQQGYPDFEHIVIDGGSKDSTVDILKEYPHLVWVSEPDEGLYDAMNKGILKATGEIVVMLNSDDYFCDGALTRVGRAFQENPSWEALFGDIIYVDRKGDEIFRREETRFDYDMLRFGVSHVIHPTFFVRKVLHERFGLYRSNEFVNCGDFDFMMTLGKAKCRIGHIPEYLAKFRYHEYGQSSDLRVMKNMARESERIMREHGNPGGLQGTLMKQFYRFKRQGLKLMIRGKCDLVPGSWKLKRFMREATQFTSNSRAPKA